MDVASIILCLAFNSCPTVQGINLQQVKDAVQDYRDNESNPAPVFKRRDIDEQYRDQERERRRANSVNGLLAPARCN